MKRSKSTVNNSRAFGLAVIIAPVTLLLLSLSAQPQEPDGVIRIVGTTRPRIPIAVPDFIQDPGSPVSDPRLGTLLAEVVSGDLDFDGDFEVFQTVRYPSKFRQSPLKWQDIDFPAWQAAGCLYLVHGIYRLDRGGNGNVLTLECRLISIKTREFVRGSEISPGMDRSGSDFRRYAHQFSDIIVETLTGREGIFQTKIAFISNQTGYKEVYVCDYDGKNPRKLTNHRSICLSPKWSPDGTLIMFNSYKNRNPDLFVMNGNGTGVKPLSEIWGLNTAADWAPDGRSILETLSKDGNSEIYRMDVRSKRLTRLTNNRVIDTEPAWSPDGKKIAYVTEIWGPAQIFSMNADGKNIKRLTSGLRGRSFSPVWSPAGTRKTREEQIAFVVERGNAADIYTMSAEGSKFQKLTDSRGLRDRNEDPAWSPDGRHLVFASSRSGKWNLYTMDVRGENVRRITFLGSDCSLPHWSPD